MRDRITNHALRILLWTNGLIIIAMAMFSPIYAIFVEGIGGGVREAGLSAGVLALAAALTTFIAGQASDRIRENELIVVVGYFVIGIGFLLLALVSSITQLLLVQALIGVGAAIFWPAYDAIFAKHTVRKKAGRQWGAWESMSYIAEGFGAILGGFLVYEFGFIAMFAIMAGLSFASGLYILFIPRKVL